MLNVCLAIVLSNGADLASTEYALSRGAHELNPLMRNTALRYSVKAASTAGQCEGMRWLRKRNPKLHNVLLGAIVGANGYLTVRALRASR